MKNPTLPDYTPTTANERYLSNNLGTWSSISDVDVFLSRFTHENDYKDGNVELALGNYVTIQDGTYNAVWVIAGFDMEYKQKSADGNIYDNGLGICLIPQTKLTTAKWNNNNILAGAYMSSYIHTTVLSNIVTSLQNVLGSHLIQRNVLLSSGVNGNYHSNAYTWTTAYATLMSVGQITGGFATYRNKYDDGEANYKLPIFYFIEYKTGYSFWTRGIWGNANSFLNTWYIGNRDGGIDDVVYATHGVRPLIYLR